MSLVQRFVRRPPAGCSGERRDGLVVSACQEKQATQRPPMKRLAARWRHASCEPEMARGAFDIALGLFGSSRILMSDVREHRKLDRPLRDAHGQGKPFLFVICEIKLPEQERLGCAVMQGSRCKPSPRPDRAGSWGLRGESACEHLFRDDDLRFGRAFCWFFRGAASLGRPGRSRGCEGSFFVLHLAHEPKRTRAFSATLRETASVYARRLRSCRRRAKVSAAMRQKVVTARSTTKTSLDQSERRSRTTQLSLPCALLVLLSFVGCGHPATRAECDTIFDRSAEIELRSQNVSDPNEISKRTAAVRAARGDDLIGKCVGRRITDKALACVRLATTAEAVDRCLD